MNPAGLLAHLHSKGITVRADGAQIRLRPRAAVTPGDLAAAVVMKSELLRLLTMGAVAPALPAAENPAVALRVGETGFDAAVEKITSMVLDRFEREGAPLEIRVAWLDTTLWFVPREADAAALAREGVTRGRIWTAGELADLLALGDLTSARARTLALTKLEFDGDIVTTRPPAASPRGTTPGSRAFPGKGP